METLSAPMEVAGVPLHVAIIMDGNGRWAAARGLRRTAGHRRGAEAVKTAAESAVRLGVRYLTLFGFSSENWRRPEWEVSELMGLLRHYLQREIGFLQEHSIRLRVIGNRARLAPDIVRSIESAEQATAHNRRLTLTMALSYGGRAEICQAARRLAEEAVAGRIDPAQIDEAMFTNFLYTHDIPDPDLVIRTSGEQRISNFLLWQVAYAELLFVDTLWPDFSQQSFEHAIREFCRRERRYGAVSA
ncbi:MAG: isoprenyl transferase [Bacteroidota bacterium]|jgi:undecaprenyl diphosphate synthase